ncbi:MAG: YhfC family intramembrane metalloprotease [Anaerolineae bacterium]|nr:YhfC family intramembrane metalloprotease [Anaerolineae bacterium]MCO5197561.1 YhfC family intramembrane metalloprotease [Anaerolineae bacterium]MCO5203816.1 YhfC family intramembrane metalloprotease [Anaerolineae bacterium]
MVYVLLTLNSLLMIVMPILLGIWLARRYKVGWSLFFLGTLGFVVSQVGHITFNQLILNPFAADTLDVSKTFGRTVFIALLFGLSAGIFEEVTRYIFYRFMKNARDWEEGVMFGAGWGGVESIILGLLAATTIVNVYIYQSGLIDSLVPADQLANNADAIADGVRQVEELVNSPPWLFLMGALERMLTLVVQIALSILVLQAFVRNRIIWLFAAIGWHTLVDMVVAFGLFQEWEPLIIEAAIAGFAILSFFIIRYFKPPDQTSASGQLTASSSEQL